MVMGTGSGSRLVEANSGRPKPLSPFREHRAFALRPSNVDNNRLILDCSVISLCFQWFFPTYRYRVDSNLPTAVGLPRMGGCEPPLRAALPLSFISFIPPSAIWQLLRRHDKGILKEVESCYGAQAGKGR